MPRYSHEKAHNRRWAKGDGALARRFPKAQKRFAKCMKQFANLGAVPHELGTHGPRTSSLSLHHLARSPPEPPKHSLLAAHTIDIELPRLFILHFIAGNGHNGSADIGKRMKLKSPPGSPLLAFSERQPSASLRITSHLLAASTLYDASSARRLWRAHHHQASSTLS